MGILETTSNYQKCIKKTNLIPDYARDYKNEYLFIRGIDKTCAKFVKILDEKENELNSYQANKLMFYFHKFLKAQEIEYLNDISELEIKEKDVNFIRSLELRLIYIKAIYGDLNINEENNFPDFKKFYECFDKFNDKLNIEYSDDSDDSDDIDDSDVEYNIILSDSDIDSDSDSDSD